MAKRRQPDANQNAARVVKRTAGKDAKPLSRAQEQAWLNWSRGVAKVDARGMALLRAAFEAGIDAAQRADNKRE